ncbi:MAG: response regulator [Candidatus Zixiibacteriota bacterium]
MSSERQSGAGHGGGNPRQRKTILVVDDDPIVIKLIQHLLAEGEYDVIDAGDGETGIRLAVERRPDLIILDVSMPIMDGYETADRLRTSPQLSSVPIVFLTARQPELDEGRAFAHGAAMYLKKPFPPDQLKQLIGRVLSPHTTSSPS